MKTYEKPQVTEEVIELQDIIALSNGGENGSGDLKSILDLGWEEE